MRHDSAGSLVHNQRSSPCVDISVLIGRWLLEKRCCINETFVWRDRSESGVSTVGDLTCSIHPETQESTEPQYTFHKRFWNICNVLQGSSNGTSTNATPYVPGCSSHHKQCAQTTAASTKSIPTYQTARTVTVPAAMWYLSNLQIDFVPIFESPNQMHHVHQSIHTAAITPWACVL